MLSYRGCLLALTVVVLALCAPESRLFAQTDAKTDAKASAKIHFQRGMTAFEAGRFSDALGEYQRAYDLLPLPGFLFNIGQCHRNLGNYQKAIFEFRLYLRKKPDAKNREAVETLIRELEAKIRSGQTRRTIPVYVPSTNPTLPPPPPPPPPPPRRPFYKTWWFWSAIVAGAGGGAVGIYFAIRPRQGSMPESDFPPWNVSLTP